MLHDQDDDVELKHDVLLMQRQCLSTSWQQHQDSSSTMSLMGKYFQRSMAKFLQNEPRLQNSDVLRLSLDEDNLVVDA